MAKKRVWELARELGIDSKQLIKKAQEAGVDIKNHQSTLTEEQEKTIVDYIRKVESGSVEVVEEVKQTPKVKVRRRRKVVHETQPEAEKKVEEEQQHPEQESKVQTEEISEPEIAEPPTEEKTEVEAPQSEQETPQEQKQVEEKRIEVPEQRTDEVSEEVAAKQPSETIQQTQQEAELEQEKEEEKQVADVSEESEQISKKEERKRTPEQVKPKRKKPKQVAQIVGRIELKPEPAKRDRTKPEKHKHHKHHKPRHEAVAKTAAELAKQVQLPPQQDRRRRVQETVIGGHRKRKIVEDLYPERLKRMAKKKKAKAQEGPLKAVVRHLKIGDSIQVAELARKMGLKAAEVVKKLFEMGMMVTANQVIDFDTAALVAAEFECELEKVGFEEEELIKEEPDPPEKLKPRPPVVTVMGHVDHGKTTLLDYIRKTNVAAKEAGGITQHIGAYTVELNTENYKGLITFIDTPGHEAFTKMRARGAQVTDIVILIVAADDGVMPQTEEAINHARAAGVPIIVAINKIDKPDANPDRVKSELMARGLVPEELGGDTIVVEISAKKGIGVEQLLEMVLLQAEMLELKANPDKRARGFVLESKLERGRGPVATLLVKEGTLKVGDHLVVGHIAGRVRTLIDDKGKRLKSAGPSTPVEVLGLDDVPEAGEEFVVMKDEKLARRLAEYRAQKLKEAQLAQIGKARIEQMLKKMQEGEKKVLKVIIKADVQGTIEALKEAFNKLKTDEVEIEVIHSGVGGVTENDVMLASASDAIIIGFNVRPEAKVAPQAQRHGVEIKLFNVIYDAVEFMKKLLTGMLEPQYEEKVLGQAEVRQIFNIAKVGTVAGCYVVDGKILRNAKVRLLRDSKVVYDGSIASLKRFKDDVSEVLAGQECGILLENYNDVKPGDVIEAYILEEITPELQISQGEQSGQGKEA